MTGTGIARTTTAPKYPRAANLGEQDLDPCLDPGLACQCWVFTQLARFMSYDAQFVCDRIDGPI